MTINTNQVLYYAERAAEYEKVYEKPERQADLKKLAVFLKDIFTEKTVLEIACGTGYWTQYIGETAQSVFATDINQNVLAIAKAKPYRNKVQFESVDMFAFKITDTIFDAGFGGFIWSHIPKQDLSAFLTAFTSNIMEGGTVVLIDNQYVTGSSTPIAGQDEAGNTYQLRMLEDQTKHKVLKNFPSDLEIREVVQSVGSDIEILRLDYYWILKFKTKALKPFI